MKLKDLFGRKRDQPSTEDATAMSATAARLDLDALDGCVGGQADTESVDCYVRSTQPRVH